MVQNFSGFNFPECLCAIYGVVDKVIILELSRKLNLGNGLECNISGAAIILEWSISDNSYQLMSTKIIKDQTISTKIYKIIQY